jgi:hypothetical protein
VEFLIVEQYLAVSTTLTVAIEQFADVRGRAQTSVLIRNMVNFLVSLLGPKIVLRLPNPIAFSLRTQNTSSDLPS